MGTVFVAFDAVLSRCVALKSIARGHADAVREGQALARLNHPNVVAVHDVSITNDGAYIVMELVNGETLDHYVARAARTWREQAIVFRQLCDGVQAIHDNGIVHRDLKPSNILVDSDGRVRIVDFGLATTNATTWAGTPAYMAPELLRGERATYASDQYSLCLTILECVTGRKLRPSSDVAIDVQALTNSTLPVPRAAKRALLRGINHEISQRHPSVSAVANALAPTTVRRSATLLVLLTLLASWLVLRPARVEQREPCPLPSAEFWSEPVRQALKAQFNDSAVFQSADAMLTAAQQKWRVRHQEACYEKLAHRTTTTPKMDCLKVFATRTSEIVHLVTQRDPQTQTRFAEAVAAGPSVEACELPPIPEVQHGLLLQVTTQLARQALAALESKQLLGLHREALREVTSLLPSIQGLNDAALTGRAYYQLAYLQVNLGALREAETSIRTAADYAVTVQDDRGATRAWTLLAATSGYMLGKQDEGAVALLSAKHWLARAQSPQDLVAEWEDVAGLLSDKAGRLNEARAHYDTALMQREKIYGKDHFMVAISLNNVAAIPYQQKKYEESLALHRRALQIRENQLGENHPDVAISLNAIAAIHQETGKLDEAEQLYRRVIAMVEKQTQDPIALGMGYNNLGNLLAGKRQYQAAARALNQAIALWLPVLGNDETVLQAKANRALALWDDQQFQPALDAINDAANGAEKLGELSPLLVAIVCKRTGVRAKLNDIRGAKSDADRCLKLLRKQPQPDAQAIAIMEARKRAL